MEYDDGQVKAIIEVKRATFGDELRRSQMIVQAAPEKGEDKYIFNSRSVIQADLRIGTKDAQISRDGVPIPEWWTYEQIVELPGELVDGWLREVYAINPHWDPARTTNGEASEKKASPSTDA